MLRKTDSFLALLCVVLFRIFSIGFLEGLQENSSQADESMIRAPNRPAHSIEFLILSPDKVKICLNMIVKNESHIIERCLNSVKDIVDCISICDTGSTDNTVELIEQFMQKNKIPGKVHRHVWENFGYNRSLSAQAANETLEELSLPLTRTYLLLLDADMILKVDPSFKQKLFTSDAYIVMQKNDVYSYYNIRLIRASLPWKCIGPTHEYWSCQQPHSELQLDLLEIDDREDGGSKADKHERDIKLLTKAMEEEPENARYMFYLAQSYRCLARFNEAIHWYKNRIAIGGWLEEVWYSKLMIGDIYKEMDFWDHALHWYLDAYETNPERAEPLQKIANHYRVKGLHHLAYLFAKRGAQIPFPKNQILFISHPVYDYQFDEEISIAAYYIPTLREEGFEAADRLGFKREVPENVKNQTYRNLLFYAENLKDADFEMKDSTFPFSEKLDTFDLPIDVSIQKIVKKEKKQISNPNYDFSSLYSSLIPIEFGEGYLMIAHQTIEADGQPHRLHRFVYLNKNGEIEKISRPFTFKHKEAEYCYSMALHDLDNQYVMTVGVGEKEHWLCSCTTDKIQTLLKPLP